MLPVNGQITYEQIRTEFGGIGSFTLQNAVNGNYGALNYQSYHQPINNGNYYSPADFYGYTGSQVVDTSLVVHWDAWPTMGSYNGGAPFVTDLSNSNSDGDLINGTFWDSDPINGGGSFMFDGMDDFILSTPPQTFNGYTNAITVDFWVKWDNPINHGQGIGQGVFNNYGGGRNPNSWLMHGNGGGADSVTFYVWTNGGVVSGGNSSTINPGEWYNLVCAMGPSSSTFYTNGVVTGTGGGLSSGMITNQGSTIFAGGDLRYDFRRMAGSMAAIKVYNRQLSSGELTSNYNALIGRFTDL
jgi:hypothetical protein